MDKYPQRFIMAMAQEDREMLRKLAEKERLTQSALVRRLIWKAAKAKGINGELLCKN
ncbi:MAG: hypothetical protein JXA21_17135 [Anaerolineae bacterium]|nr:hypothetical protein [Anaerolineae bacterium]